jgi:uncharacterized protein YrrD
MSAGAAGEEIDTGYEVLDSGGNKVGSVAYLVVDPQKLHLTDVVVSTGAILGRDVVVPTDAIDSVAGGKVHLNVDKQQVQSYSDYIEINYRQPPQDWTPPAGYMYPTAGMLWPTYSYYPEPADVKVNAPKGTIGLSTGMDVESSDGHKVGTVHGLDVNASGDVTGFIVQHGFFFHHDTTIPIDQVQEVTESTVKLKLNRDAVKGLEGK